MQILNFILLQVKGFDPSLLVTMGAAFLVMYFFMIRPQQKKQNDQKKFLTALKKGDNVVTIGGLHGKIHEIDELTLILEVDRGMRLKFDRSAISLEGSKRVQSEITA
jgi:preprotein translocase subunit YajC